MLVGIVLQAKLVIPSSTSESGAVDLGMADAILILPCKCMAPIQATWYVSHTQEACCVPHDSHYYHLTVT